MTTKRPKTAPVFDASQFARPRHTITRELEREGRAPIRVEVLDLSVAETNAIEYKPTAPVKQIQEQIAPYVVGWDFRATNKVTGELVDVPPPAEAGWEVLDLLNSSELGDLISWLKWPHQMEQLTEKKRALEEAKRFRDKQGTPETSGSPTSITTPTRPKPAT